MHQIRKAWWSLRAVFLSPLLGAFQLPGYIGPVKFILGAKRIYLGKRVRIFPGLRAEAYPGGRITIEDDVSIGQDFHVTALGDLRIGKGTLISGQVFITDADHSYEDVSLPVHRQPLKHSPTYIGENCFIGIGARIQAGTTLGPGCIVGSNAVVKGTFPAHCVIVGAPGQIMKIYNPDSGQWERRKV